MAGGSVRAQMVRSRQVLRIFIGKTRAGRNQWLSCSPGLLLMSFSVLCVGQEVLLQPRVFNSPFQRAGVINCTLCPCNKVIYLYLHLSSPLLGIAKNFSARSLALSQPEISLITELKSSCSASNWFFHCPACLELPKISLFGWEYFLFDELSRESRSCSPKSCSAQPLLLPQNSAARTKEAGWAHEDVFGAVWVHLPVFAPRETQRSHFSPGGSDFSQSCLAFHL